MHARDLVGAGLALMLAAAPLLADELTPVRAFRAFTRDNAPELPESIVGDLLQDAEGVLWIETLGGLATFDGVSVRAVRDPDAPRGPSTLAPRRAGGMYAVSRQGLHVLDGRWRRVPTPSPLRSLSEEDGRWLWTVQEDALVRTRAAAPGASWETVAVPELSGPPRAVFADPTGGVFVFGRDRIVHCRERACRAVPAAGTRPPGAANALVTHAGVLWLGTSEGRLWSARPGDADWTTVDLGAWPSGGVRSLAEDHDGHVWAGGMARLCHEAAGGGWSCWGAEAGLPRSAILGLLADREGTLWLGLNGAGLRQWVGQPWTHLTAWPGDGGGAEGLDVIGLASTARGGVLVSAFGRGILRWEGGRFTTWGAADGLTEDVRAVVEPAPDEVWAGTRQGVFEKRGAGRFQRTLALAGFASGFVRAPDGVWHVWTDGDGIFRRRGAGWEHASDLEALAGPRGVRTLTWTDDGDVWISTGGLLLRRTRAGVVTRHTLGLEHGWPDSVTSVLSVAPGEIWAGGQGGLAIVGAGGVRLLGDADGVPGNVYFLRRAPDGAVWVGGSRGIARVRGGRWERWDRSSGLVGDECNGGALVGADGSLLATTGGSLARFDPGVPPPPRAALHVAWREPAPTDGVIVRAAGERSLQLAWSAPWLGPDVVEYSTRIGEGPWSPATREAHLSIASLAAGATTVAVRARRAGVHEDWTPPAILQVEVAPHLWETATARAAALALIAAAMLAAAHLLARRQHAHGSQALERMRADFMASASHELRTPIAQIRLFTDMLRLGRARDPAERADALDTIHRATARLESLAANLLQLARGQAPSPEPSVIDVSAVVRETLRDLASTAEARGAALVVEIEPGLRALADGEGLRRILVNLVENAVKYGPAGQSVRISAETTPAGLRLEVEDEGPGIPAADRDRVFRRFERLERDRDRGVSGTGLGLAVVQDAVHRAGGEVRIEDAAAGGTRVVVVLPQPDADGPTSGEPRHGVAR